MTDQRRVESHGEIPRGARPVARILVISNDFRLLLLQGKGVQSYRWWVSPGGGLQPGESFVEAAVRELREETGFEVPIGPCVWIRRHRFEWHGKQLDQYERFFVAPDVPLKDPTLKTADEYIFGFHWWTLGEIGESSDHFAPRRLADLLPPILQAKYPKSPIDVGV